MKIALNQLIDTNQIPTRYQPDTNQIHLDLFRLAIYWQFSVDLGIARNGLHAIPADHRVEFLLQLGCGLHGPTTKS